MALTDVAELHAHLRGQEKDRMSLVNAKARLRVIDEQVGDVFHEMLELHTLAITRSRSPIP